MSQITTVLEVFFFFLFFFLPFFPPPPLFLSFPIIGLSTQTHSHSIDSVSLLLDQLGQTAGMRLHVQHPEGKCAVTIERCNLKSFTLQKRKFKLNKNRWGELTVAVAVLGTSASFFFFFLFSFFFPTQHGVLDHMNTPPPPPVRTKSPIRPGAAGTLRIRRRSTYREPRVGWYVTYPLSAGSTFQVC